MNKPTSEISLIKMQVMWDRLISVVEEQAQALVRTAFSTSVREGGDLAAAVFDDQGRMLAQAVTGTPGHINAMAEAVVHFTKKFPVEIWSLVMFILLTIHGKHRAIYMTLRS